MNCLNCNAEIPVDNAFCGKCGAPVGSTPAVKSAPSGTTPLQALCIFGIALAAFFGLFALNGLTPAKMSANRQAHLKEQSRLQKIEVAKKQDEEMRLVAITVAEGAVKGRLKSPSTASFAWYGSDECKMTKDGNSYDIYSHVDSQNSFGGTVRTKWYAKVKPIPGTNEAVIEKVELYE